MDGTQWLHSTRARHLQDQMLCHFYRGLPNTEIANCKYGALRIINASQSYKVPDWNQTENIRGNQTLEPMGLLGDVGWYAIGAILFAMDYRLPYRVCVTYVTFNQQKVITTCAGTLWFRLGEKNEGESGDAMEVVANFDCGGETARRSTYEFLGGNALVRDGAFNNRTYKESGYYKFGDVAGKESVVEVGQCYQSINMIEAFSNCVLTTPNFSWPKKSLSTQVVLDAVFLSASTHKQPVEISENKNGEVTISVLKQKKHGHKKDTRKLQEEAEELRRIRARTKRFFFNVGRCAFVLVLGGGLWFYFRQNQKK